MRDLDAKVATVLDDRRVALNVGSDLGVQEGDDVTLWDTVEVKDPDTSKPLGVVRLPKLALQVEHVQELLSVAKIPTEAVNFSGLFVTSQTKKRLATSSSAPGGNIVRVKVGEEATVHLQSRKDGPSPDEP